MRDNQTSLRSGIVLVVGMATAMAVYLGLSQIAAGLHTIPVPAPTSMSYSVPSPTVAVLSPGRFVVVYDRFREVYDVNAAGHIRRVDAYDPAYLHGNQDSPPQVVAPAAVRQR